MFKNQSCLDHGYRAKTVERLLVDRKNAAAEATEWVDDLNQPEGERGKRASLFREAACV